MKFTLLTHSLMALILLLIVNIPTWAQYEKLDDIGAIRYLYPQQALVKNESTANQNLTTAPATLSPAPLSTPTSSLLTGNITYQVGENPQHKVAVISRILGRFTKPEIDPELLVTIAVDTGSAETNGIVSGVYTLLFNLDQYKIPQLLTRPALVQRQLSLANGQAFFPVLLTDIDLDKQDELIAVQSDREKLQYFTYRWQGKDFAEATDHPLQPLLGYYGQLAAAVQVANKPDVSARHLQEALQLLTDRLQSQQSAQSLQRRLQGHSRLLLESVKVLIRGGNTNALLRIKYRLDGGEKPQLIEADYQARRINERWLLDTERLKVLPN
jgi:hypothetical protein